MPIRSRWISLLPPWQGIVLAFACLFIWPPPIPADDVAALPARVIPVLWVDHIEMRKTFTGRLEPRRAGRLGFAIPGRLDAVHVDEGDRVRRGDVLAELAPERYAAHLHRAEADLARARAQLAEMEAGPRAETVAAARSLVQEYEVQVELGRLKAARRSELLESRTISTEEHEEALLLLRSLEARLDSARHQLAELEAGTRAEQLDAQRAHVDALHAVVRQARIDLDGARLRAPFDAVLNARLLDEGAVIDAGVPILELIEDGPLRARVGVPPAAAASLTEGDILTLRVAGSEFEAVVAALLPELTAETRTVPVILSLSPEAAASPLRAGELVRLDLPETVAMEGVWLPTAALVRGIRGLWSCNVILPSAAASDPPAEAPVERRDVELLHTEGDRVLVRGPLRSGEWIVEAGNHRIVPGQRVRPIPAEL
jgi:RND family efflux transporter MFP subunit